MCVVLSPQVGFWQPQRLNHTGKCPLSPRALGSHNHQLAVSAINQSSAFTTSLLVYVCFLAGPAENPRCVGSTSSNSV